MPSRLHCTDNRLHDKELCFSNIYCGLRSPPLSVSYHSLVKWELRNADRRAASCINNIFFKLRKCNTTKLSSLCNIGLRKSELSGKADLNVGKLLNALDCEALLKANIGFSDLKCLRDTPHYHDQGKKHLFAMLRQEGSCTFFLTTSTANTRWPKLLCCLILLVDKKKLTKEEAVSLPYLERARLV
jgi:hypothetical protein